MNRRNALGSIFAGAAASLGGAPLANAAQVGTKHIRIYVEMEVAADKEKEMLDTFHNVFVPEAVKHEGYIRVKLLKLVSVIQGKVPTTQNYRFELEFENEVLRQKWVKSPEHQRVWPQVERFMTTRAGYPVTLYEEA